MSAIGVSRLISFPFSTLSQNQTSCFRLFLRGAKLSYMASGCSFIFTKETQKLSNSPQERERAKFLQH